MSTYTILYVNDGLLTDWETVEGREALTRHKDRVRHYLRKVERELEDREGHFHRLYDVTLVAYYVGEPGGILALDEVLSI